MCQESEHAPVAGMMAVHVEDLDTVAAVRPVTCKRCDGAYSASTGTWVDTEGWYS